MESVFIKEECVNFSSDDESVDSTENIQDINDERICKTFKEEDPLNTSVEAFINERICESLIEDVNLNQKVPGYEMTGNVFKENTSQTSTKFVIENETEAPMDSGVVPCPNCDSSFISFSYLEAHQKMCRARLHLKEIKDACLTTKENIQSYKVVVSDRNHSDMYEKSGKEYLCKVCTYMTKKCSSMKAHLRTHTGDRPFRCAFCSYAAAEAGQVRRHMRVHSGERPYSCAECNYSASVITNLKNHMLVHSGTRPFTCDRCPFTCTQATSLKEHLRTHTGEKPFRCSFCQYCCSRSNSLKRHLMTHTGQRPFQCTVCEYRCCETGALKAHMRTHTGERPFACTLCAYRSIQSGELRRHLRTKHKCDPDLLLPTKSEGALQR